MPLWKAMLDMAPFTPFSVTYGPRSYSPQLSPQGESTGPPSEPQTGIAIERVMQTADDAGAIRLTCGGVHQLGLHGKRIRQDHLPDTRLAGMCRRIGGMVSKHPMMASKAARLP